MKAINTTRILRSAGLVFQREKLLPMIMVRTASTTDPVAEAPKRTVLNIFDRKAKLMQRERAIRFEEPHVYDYLREEVNPQKRDRFLVLEFSSISLIHSFSLYKVGYVLADRVLDIQRDLKLILDLGCGKGHVLRHLNSVSQHETLHTFCGVSYFCISSIKFQSRVNSVIATDACQSWLDQAEVPDDISFEKIIMDEENITFEENKFNLVVSCLKYDLAYLLSLSAQLIM